MAHKAREPLVAARLDPSFSPHSKPSHVMHIVEHSRYPGFHQAYCSGAPLLPDTIMPAAEVLRSARCHRGGCRAQYDRADRGPS